MASITDAGYVLETQNEWFADELALYQAIDPNWNLDPSTPDGLKLAHDSEVYGELDALGLQAYNSKDPNKARGVDLDVVCALTGTFREDGTPSNVAIQLNGVTGTLIPAGSKIRSTVDETEWSTDANITLVAGVGTGTATAVLNGATQADIGTITQIVDTVGGWQTATNTAVATSGTDPQTDGQLRLDRNNQVGRPGNNQIESMLGEIGAVEDVRKFLIYNNKDNSTDANGIPAHSMAIFVDGGTDEAVGQAIYNKLTPGCGLDDPGTPVSVVVTSAIYPQQSETIVFSRPIANDIIISVNIQNDGSLSAGVQDEIKQAIISYANGTFTSAIGFNTTGFEIAEDVPSSRLYTPVNSVIGGYGNSYILSLTVNGSLSNAAVAFNEISRFTDGNITVII